MSTAVKRKRVSKKNKASWRKYTDIKDVENFLEDQRLEERIGKAALKKDEELFTIDTTGEDKEKPQKIVSQKAKRKENARKPPRSLAALENTSKVEDPITKRNHIKQKISGKDVISQVLAGKTSTRITRAFEDSKRYSLNAQKEKEKRRIKIFRNNLWEETDELAPQPELKDAWVGRDLAIYHLQNTRKRLMPRPTTADLKTTKAKALDLPHPGMSYNPSLRDHQDLIGQVLERESKIIKQEAHLKRVTTDMFSKVTEAERDFAQLKEAASGFNIEGEDENASDKDIDMLESLSANPPVQNKKKDKKARRKQREQRELLQERKTLKLEKKKITDIHRLRAITSEVIVEEGQSNDLMKRRKQAAKEKNYKPRRLAKLKFEESEIPVNMVTDLSGNLRNLKTESSVLVDRFKSLQKRNILPPSVDVGVRKRRKIKRFVRSTHKDAPQPIKKKSA